MSPDSPMDLVHITGKKRRGTGGITRLFPEDKRQIGGEYGGIALISVSLGYNKYIAAPLPVLDRWVRRRESGEDTRTKSRATKYI
jgi:hypothetical protein